MKTKFVLAMSVSLLPILAYAATQTTVPYTFACTGNVSLREGTCPNGGRPDSLIQGSDGNFYGTAQVSMEGTSGPTGGTIFSLTPSGTLKLLHTFTLGPNKNYPQGNLPGSLVQGADGKIYGTTPYGGVDGCDGYCGFGVMFRINTDGTGFQILHRFCSQTNCADGSSGVLIAAPDGNLYMASAEGGTGTCTTAYQSCGAIVRVTPSTGACEIVFSFDTTSGINPAKMTLAADGTFYGLDQDTLSSGLFHFDPTANQVTTVSVKFPLFSGLPSAPASELAIGANGKLYGIYMIYGTSGAGVFEVQTDGSNLNLFSFYTTQDGAGAPQEIFSGTDGNLWVDNFNGSTGYGSLMQISPSTGQLMQTVTPFGANMAAGAYPQAIFQASDGTFWGTTDQYGKVSKGFADGAVFSLNLGLPPKR